MTTTTTTGLVQFLYSSLVNIRCSSYYEADYGQHNLLLNFVGNSGTGSAVKPVSSWCAQRSDANQHIMLGTAVPCTFNALSIQGRGDSDQWVTTYKVMYSLDGATYSDYNSGAAIAGTTGRNVIATHHFNPPIVARSIMVIPLTWYGYISVRMELYGKCTAPGQGGSNTTPHPMAKYLGKKVFLKSIAQDAFVRNNNGVIDLSANQKKLEEWTVEDAGNGKVNFVNTQFKKYLALAPGSTTLSHADKSTPANIEWTPVEKSPGKFTFKSSGGSLLKGTAAYEVEADAGMPDPDHEFEVVDA